jgi:hypothetical protein
MSPTAIRLTTDWKKLVTVGLMAKCTQDEKL